MNKSTGLILVILSMLISSLSHSGWVEGTPVQVMKSDYGSLHVTYIKFETPISSESCSSGDGVVVLDENESSTVATSLALTAFASGKKFRCYVSGECSRTTGGVTTYQVCSHYPSITN